MRITFDVELDGGAWPGPLGEGAGSGCEPDGASPADAACFGHAWLGSAGLLHLLETALGLGGPQTPSVVRAAMLMPRLRSTEGFWSRSAEADSFACARTLLRWRDALWSAGWRGQSRSPRLAALGAITADLPAGTPDRLAEVAEALTDRGADIETLCLIAPPSDGAARGRDERASRVAVVTGRAALKRLPRPWQRVCERLEAHGTRVEAREVRPADAQGDLGAVREGGSVPRGDGSLQLVRPPGPLQAAEDIAAWLAALPSLRDTVLIAPDPTLDAALRRFGLPTTGASGGPYDDALLQILPLVLALGWSPPDPQRVLELLTLPTSPIPGRLARELIDALHEAPAVGSLPWDARLEGAVAPIDDEPERKSAADRLAVLFAAEAPHGAGYPVAALTRRLSMLAHWMQARKAKDAEEPERWNGPLTQIATLARMVELAALDELRAPELQRFVDAATLAVGGKSRFRASAGLASVASPGAIVGPADHIVWCGFTRASAPAPLHIPLSPEEHRTLADGEVALPDPGAEAVMTAERWRRPLLCARRHLLLVCPSVDDAAEEQFPHPLWDELTADLGPGGRAEAMSVLVPKALRAPARSARPLQPLPAPLRSWQLPRGARIQRRDRESPSSLSTLIGCPFKWVCEYAGKLRGGGTGALAADRQLLGTLIHAVIAELLTEWMEETARHRATPPDPPSPERAAERAGALFDERGPRIAASLFLPGAQAQRAMARRIAAEAASVLVRVLSTRSLRPVAVEQELERAVSGVRVRGRPDLVVARPTTVVDLKFGGAGRHRDALRAGASVQLAAYSFLAQPEGAASMPDVAYFILSTGQMLTTARDAMAGAEAIDGPLPADVWQATLAAHERAWDRFDRGEIVAAGVPDGSGEEPPSEGALVDGELVLSPPCRFCDYGALCGAAYSEAP